MEIKHRPQTINDMIESRRIGLEIKFNEGNGWK